MARSRRSSTTPNSKKHPATASLEDALAATHHQTVPILPALEADEPLPEPDPPTRPTKSFARTTLAPKTATTAGASTAGPRPTQRPKSALSSTSARMRAVSPDLAERATAVIPLMSDPALPAVAPQQHGGALVTTGSTEAPILIKGAKKPPRYSTVVAPKRLAPRPVLLQFALSMVTVMAVFTTLTLASPVGQSVLFSTTHFDAYAQAFPWYPPTPTPRPTPTPVPAAKLYLPPPGTNPGKTAIINDIQAVFGQYTDGALHIANCESGFDPNAVNPYAIGNSHASGVFQILYPSTWDGTSYHAYSPFDYDKNIHAAYEIFHRDGNTWSEWACKPY